MSVPLASERPDAADDEFLGLSRSTAMKSVLDNLRREAATDRPILLVGESGTGKSCLAKQIHRWSPRMNGPYIKRSLADANENLATSALFGHEKGAFTGAIRDRGGAFLTARGGTLLLDELGHASKSIQAALLRVLEDGTVVREGSDREIACDVRVILAMSEDPREAVGAGRLLTDLYGRMLHSIEVLPPLRERPEDIPALARWYVSAHSAAAGYDAPPRISERLMRILCAAEWPWNLRELSAAVWRIVREASPDAELRPEHCRGYVLENAVQSALRTREKPSDEDLLRVAQATGNSSETATILGLNRETVARRLGGLGGAEDLALSMSAPGRKKRRVHPVLP